MLQYIGVQGVSVSPLCS